ncbi:MAG TPA: lyase family protein [Thermoanaerobaculia bacterium]|nr:lyase family protein [Thermoanaerobaculia bacterium]
MATRKAAFRIEKDTLGEVRVPASALYGAQTRRAVENFPVSGLREHPAFIRAYVLIKKAAAVTNHQLGPLEKKLASAISSAADEVLGEGAISFETLLRSRGESSPRRDDLRSAARLVPSRYVSETLRGQFVVDVFQAGAGTSFNMNCNEVLANLANRALGGKVGEYRPVHPNDHVNMAQSTNDTFPTAIRVAALLLLRELFPALDGMSSALEERGRAFDDVIKSGRTHLQDAVPVTLGQELRAWAAAVRRATDELERAADHLRLLGIGGTATGTGLNAPPGFRYAMVSHLGAMTALRLESQPDLREAMQSQFSVGAVSSALRGLALELTRITNDLRLLSSGPLTGLAEIRLPAVQPGSSIMPGKVNPSMLECMNQVCFRVIGSATAIDYALQAGQLELNVMMPLMAYEMLFSMEILANYVPVFVEKCVSGIDADRERCEAYYVSSPALATVLNPILGYARAAEIAKEAARTRRPIPELLREKKLLPESEIRRIFTPEFLTGQADRRPAKGRAKPRPAGKRGRGKR